MKFVAVLSAAWNSVVDACLAPLSWLMQPLMWPAPGEVGRPRPVEYAIDHVGNITLPAGAPFDGEPVLIKIGAGWVEAWWQPSERSETLEGTEYSGFCWVCLDDSAPQADLDDATLWMPLPVEVTP